MVFKKMMRAFGVGGPTVDTIVSNPNTRPGLALEGQVEITGGDHPVEIEYVTLGLVTRVEIESHGGGELDSLFEFHRVTVAGAFPLRAGEQRVLPFRFPVPWETPVTDVYGQRLPGMTMALRTGLSVAKAVDKSDLDVVHVHPLPAQERILAAFSRLGFRFARADLERGHLRGVPQTLPFYQEIEFRPSPRYARGIAEVEVTFVAGPTHLDVVLEFDKRGGFVAPGHDSYGHFRVAHAEAERTDWTAVVEGWVRQAGQRYASLRKHGGGLGTGAAVAGGLLGGMVLGDVLDDLFE